MSQRPTEDKILPLSIAPLAFCPRKLKPGMAKRYMSKGPLVGYMIACPSCGFVELHLEERAGYCERGGVLVATTRAAKCMVCGRAIRVFSDGTGTFIEAKLELPAEQLPM